MVRAELAEQSRQSGPESTSYAPPPRGIDRKLSRQGSRTGMGTSQTFGGSSTLGRRGEPMDQGSGRDTMSRGGPAPRQPGHYAGSGLPSYGTRPPSRPASSAVGQLASPRGHNPSSSYRDAAMIAAQHGLGAYGPSAAAAAAASRNLTSRSGTSGAPANGLHSSHGLGGHPGPLPRHPQHGAHMGHYYAHHQYGQYSGGGGGGGGTERLPSRSGPPPSRGGMPPSRSGMPPSRSGPPPSRGGAGGGGGPPPPTSPGAYHRATDAPHGGEGPWRGSHDPVGQEEGGPGVVLVHPLAMGAGTGPRGVAPAGWGAAAGPSPYEVDGRPGTRGGGPQYDMEGRPTTRGGQRPPSRAQLGIGGSAPPKPPPGGLIPPLGGAGWAGMFAGAGGGATGGSATSPSGGLGPGGGGAAGGGGSGDLSNSLRRSMLPLPPSLGPSANGTGGLGSKTHGTGVLSSMGPTHGHLSGTGTLTNTGRMVSKLTSIAEAPSSPSMLSPKTPSSRIGSAGGGGGGGGGGSFGRKSSRERDLMLSSIPDGAAMDAFLDGISEEGADGIQDSDIDSYLANMDQDSGGNRGKLGSRRSNASSNASGSNSRQQSSHGGAPRGGGAGGALESPTSARR
ncbi:hypothetical protein HXX76_000710 [Chlamydomonas incerta]|uniref:Uncharacterized protein n=1 Tax=Chlamydomonas incerta TaxID=51695 RepID=A0A835WEV8_CHLIN|nr:hypothetical protein HXX76_000710 [Chlamydomonas incerta]|eukprot:KAG2446111.1 hypothetical protein HXX76_000710 [Chlamydomonas incerta]